MPTCGANIAFTRARHAVQISDSRVTEPDSTTICDLGVGKITIRNGYGCLKLHAHHKEGMIDNDVNIRGRKTFFTHITSKRFSTSKLINDFRKKNLPIGNPGMIPRDMILWIRQQITNQMIHRPKGSVMVGLFLTTCCGVCQRSILT